MTTSSMAGGIRVRSRTSGEEWEFAPGRNLVLARDPDADIPLRHPKVSRTGHAELRWSEDGWVLHDTSAHLGGVMVNGTRQRSVAVTGVLVVQLGDGQTGEELELRPVPAATSAPAPQVMPERAAVSVPDSPPVIAPEPPPVIAPEQPPVTGPQPPATPVTGPRPSQMPSGGWPESIGIKPGMSVIHQVPAARVLIGRAPDCDIVLSDLLVSRHHAELLRQGAGWTLRDLGSHNGTYVDGMRISVVPVTPNSVVGIGHQTFHLVGDTLEEFRDTGEVALDARQLVVQIGAKRLLDEVSFHLAPSSMLAIVGPSGAGKSTLLRALTGLSPATSGYVSYDGRDLYSNYDEIRHRIGYVPQDDILHPQLRVRRALSYSAQLRFPQDVPAVQRDQRVQEVIEELGLTNQAEQRISTLSGGQRKRTSTALELLTRPTLLFLDEPTSGLDVLREREVMQSLRRLADGGRTVIVVSHAIANLDICDRLLVLAPGGQVAYYGPPQKALEYFGVTSYEDAFAQLEAGGVNWRARYQASPEHAAYATVPPQAPLAGQFAASGWVSPPRQQSAASQYATLTRRYLSVISADKQFVLLTAVSPLALAALARAVPASGGLNLASRAYRTSTGVTTHNAVTLLLVLVLGGCLVGVASSLWEIVKERSIFLRERLIGLSWGAYLASKATVLGAVTAIQAVILVWLGMIGRDGPAKPLIFGSGTFEIVVVVLFVTVASMALGLVLSALVSNPERAMPLLVLVVMGQMVASGGLFAVHGRVGLEELAAVLPARWSFAGGAASVGLGGTSLGKNDAAWHHTSTALFVDLFLVALLAALFLGLTGLLLRRVGRPTGRVGAQR